MNEDANSVNNTAPHTPIIRWILFVVLALSITAAITLIFISYGTNTAVYKSLVALIQGSKPPTPTVSSESLVNAGFKVQNPIESGKNTYTFVGKFFNINVANSLIYIKDNAGGVYAFRIANYLYSDKERWLKIYTVPNMATLISGKAINPFDTPPPDTSNLLTSSIQISLTNNNYQKDLTTIMVRWNDLRSLSQLATDIQNNPNTPLNDASPDNIILAEIK